jgi:hypothetical protein
MDTNNENPHLTALSAKKTCFPYYSGILGALLTDIIPMGVAPGLQITDKEAYRAWALKQRMDAIREAQDYEATNQLTPNL